MITTNFHYYTVTFVTDSELGAQAARRIAKYIAKQGGGTTAVVVSESLPLAAAPNDFLVREEGE